MTLSFRSSLALALSANNFAAVELLIQNGARLHPGSGGDGGGGGGGNLESLLVQSILSNQTSVALAVVRSGGLEDPDFADSAGMTPLHLAAR